MSIFEWCYSKPCSAPGWLLVASEGCLETDDMRQCVSLTLHSPVHTIHSHSNEESGVRRDYANCLAAPPRDPLLVVSVMLVIYELFKWVSMDREEHEITFSVTALSVYAVSCLFFIFLVASLYIIGLTPWRACLG